jgi:Tfp pilus assembly protein PilX
MRRRLKEESGVALISALVLMGAMFGLGLATLSTVDVQSKESGASRVRETAFNLAEAAMNAQIFQMSSDWPGAGSAASPYPACTQTTTHPRCPEAGEVTAMFSGADVDPATTTWTTGVHDNASGEHFSDDATGTAPGYDANGDGRVWIRSQATAKGRTRTIIGLVRAQEVPEDLPRGALITGRLDISNSGHKAIIDAQGGSAQSGIVAVRCTPQSGELAPCLGHPLGGGLIGGLLSNLLGLLNHQITPNITQTGYGSEPAMTPEARARLKATAIANGTYYASGCPSAEGLSGQIVYIENGDCFYTSNTQFNSPESPGMVLVARGSLYIGGTSNYHGIIYHANEAASTGTAVQVQGNATVHGGVLVDGEATTIAGSSKLNIRLDPNAFNRVRSYGSVGVVQNTWREIRPNN